jgi:phosphopantetheinyl transferase (holo-ACP synthase)
MGRSLSQSSFHGEGNRLVSKANSTSGMFCHPLCSEGGISQGNRMGASKWYSMDGHRKAKEVIETLRIHKALLTLSHEHPYTVAHVLLEERDDESSDC